MYFQLRSCETFVSWLFIIHSEKLKVFRVERALQGLSLRMSPEGTRSLLSVCYSAFRDRLTSNRDLYRVSSQTSSSPRRCRLVARGGYFTHRLREVNCLFFGRWFFFSTPFLPASPVSRSFRCFFQPRAPSLESRFRFRLAGAFRQRGAVTTPSSPPSQQPFFGCFLRRLSPSPLEIRRSRSRPPPRSCTLPSRPFRRRLLPSASGGQ
jgi:hypothetical protein